MYTLSVKNDREDVLPLTGNKNYTVYKIEGLNPPPVTVNHSVNSTTDGSTINSVRLGNRNIVIYMAIEGNVEANRINLYKYFPLKKTVTLYFKNDTRDVYIEGTVELIECDLFSNKQVAQISIICPQPYFKDVEELISYFSDVSSLFEFPFSIAEEGTELSAITTSVRKSIINVGDIESGIIIDVYAIGSVVNPVIYDVLARTHIRLLFTMEANDRIVINTNVGKKSIKLIRNGVETNILGYMLPDSKWFTLKSGDNVFTYDADNGTSNMQITFTTSVLYGGV
ncbi:MAG: phage tail family protein [Lachnospiraceae bacterium]|nr:phage tail family protein [Lachnospiraceae bacterium]